MDSPTGQNTITVQNDIRKSVSAALDAEAKYLHLSPHKGSLFEGERIPNETGRHCYRFDIPENFVFHPGMEIQCAIGSTMLLTFTGRVVQVSASDLVLELPLSFGDRIPQISCTWDTTGYYQQFEQRFEKAPITDLVLHLTTGAPIDSAAAVKRDPIFPSTFTASQQAALKTALGQRYSLIDGGRRSGKTTLAAAIACNLIREGKRLLFVAQNGERLAEGMREILHINEDVGLYNSIAIDRGLLFREQIPMGIDQLLPEWHRIKEDPATYEIAEKIQMVQAENIYAKISELSVQMDAKKKFLEQKRIFIQQLKNEITELNNQSFLARIKSRTGKEVVEEKDALLREENLALENIQTEITRLTSQIGREELRAPVPLKRKTVVERSAAAIPPPAKFDQESILKLAAEKRLIGISIALLSELELSLLGPFDAVVIDDADGIPLPYAMMVVSAASERCIFLGNGSGQIPTSHSQSEQVRLWLQESACTMDARRREEGKGNSTPIRLETIEGMKIEFERFIKEGLVILDTESKEKIYFIDTTDPKNIAKQYAGKKKILPANEIHADRVVECVKHALLAEKYSQEDLLVVVPPSGQSLLLHAQLRMHGLNRVEIASLGNLPRVRRRGVIFDTVVSGLDFTLRPLDDKKIDKEKVKRLLRTLFSSAVDSLYVIADMGHFNQMYTGRYITKVLDQLKVNSKPMSAIQGAARKYDEIPQKVREMIVRARPAELASAEFRSALERELTTKAEAQKDAAMQTVAAAENKLRKDVRLAAQRIVAKRNEMNLLAQYLEREPIFSATTETADAARAVAAHDCENENDFKTIIDIWNLLLYETTSVRGPNHYLVSRGKLDTTVVWELTQIRSFYRSDLEMTVEEGKHKLAQTVQKIFQDCIGKKPVTPADWMQAYIAFLARVEKYLDAIAFQLRS